MPRNSAVGNPGGHSSVATIMHRDHGRITQALQEVDGVVQGGDLARAQDLFARAQEHILGHMDLEEDLLFPVFQRSTGMYEGPTTELARTHRSIRTTLRRLHRILEDEGGEGWPQTFGQLRHSLELHLADEERLLYPLVDRHLDPAQRDDLVARLDRLNEA